MFTACREYRVNIYIMCRQSVGTGVAVSTAGWFFLLLRGLSKSTNIVLMFTLDEGRRKCKRKYV